jgi:hypothetical protein
MGMVKFSVKAGVSMLVLYFVALFLQGERGEATEVFETFQGFAQDIAAMDQGTLVGAAMVGFFAYMLFTVD